MRVTKQKVAENRDRVVAAAAQLFRERGFDGVSVAQAMTSAGMTHGGFYNHFAAKEDLEAAALAHVFQASLAKIEAVAAEPDAGGEAFARYCQSYVSAQARDAQGAGCPMVAFAVNAPRRGDPVSAAYAEGFRAYLKAFAQASGMGRAEAIMRFAMLAGALTLARSVATNDPELSDEILAAAQNVKPPQPHPSLRAKRSKPARP